MILAAQHLRERKGMITPFFPTKQIHANGMSYGCSHVGYDVRIDQDVYLEPKEFKLASTMELFNIPLDLCADVKDKSSWARRGLQAFNTIIEPGWKGYLTLELVNHSAEVIFIEAGEPIVQIVFSMLTEGTDTPYSGKYQNQERGAQAWRQEKKL